MNREEDIRRKIDSQSGGFRRADLFRAEPQSNNKIEEALAKARNANALPPLEKRVVNPYEPLKVEREIVREITEEKELKKDEKKKEGFIFLKKPMAVFLLSAALIGSITYGGFAAYKNYAVGNQAEEEMENLLAAVGGLIEVPDDEVPTIATVEDPEELQDQEFFRDAMVGDKVLIFSRSKKAVLYRPSENMIIVIAPLNN